MMTMKKQLQLLAPLRPKSRAIGLIRLFADAEATEIQAVTPEVEDSMSLWHRSQRVPDMHGPSNPFAAASESRNLPRGTVESLQRWEDQSKFGATSIPMPTRVVWDPR